MKRYLHLISLNIMALLLGPAQAFAEDGSGSGAGLVAISAAFAIGIAAFGGTISQGKVVSAGLDAIGRNPSAAGKMFTPMILGLAFIESLVIVSFVIAYLLISG